jgi:hypothetical protein
VVHARRAVRRDAVEAQLAQMKERADALAQNAGAQALVERQARGYLLQHVVLQLLQRRRRDQRLHVSGGHRSERRGIVKCDLQSAWWG